MQKVNIATNSGITIIEAPEGKTMVFDQDALRHGVLVLGEYGPSGVKLAAFKDWNEAIFINDGDAGYSVKRP